MRMSFDVTLDDILDMIVANAASKGVSLNRGKIHVTAECEQELKPITKLVVSLDMKGMADAGNLTASSKLVRGK